jgi:phosphinothricin acetyltransferase
VIRAATPADAHAIAAIYAPHVLHGHVTFEESVPDAEEMARRIAGARHSWLVMTEDDAVLGYAYASALHPRAAYRWAVETSIYIASHAQGRGVGRHLYEALLQALERRGFTQALARIALPGEASVALHRALGFTAIGVERAVGYKHGRWIDVGLWQRALAEPDDPPRAPTS